jgi:syntaxin 12/13
MNDPLLNDTLDNKQKHIFTETDLIEERAQDTKNIETDITEINQIYNDVAILVNEQQEGLNNVETLVDEGDYNIKKGVNELGQAKKLQNKVRKKTCCITIFLLIVIIIILVPIFFNK